MVNKEWKETIKLLEKADLSPREVLYMIYRYCDDNDNEYHRNIVDKISLYPIKKEVVK